MEKVMAAFRPAWEAGASSASGSGSGAGRRMMVGWTVGSFRMGAGTTAGIGAGMGANIGSAAGVGAISGVRTSAGASIRFGSMCFSSQSRSAPQRVQRRARVALGMPQVQTYRPCWARK